MLVWSGEAELGLAWGLGLRRGGPSRSWDDGLSLSARRALLCSAPDETAAARVVEPRFPIAAKAAPALRSSPTQLLPGPQPLPLARHLAPPQPSAWLAVPRPDARCDDRSNESSLYSHPQPGLDTSSPSRAMPRPCTAFRSTEKAPSSARSEADPAALRRPARSHDVAHVRDQPRAPRRRAPSIEEASGTVARRGGGEGKGGSLSREARGSTSRAGTRRRARRGYPTVCSSVALRRRANEAEGERRPVSNERS